MPDRVIFRLKRHWIVEGRKVDLYQEIKENRKKVEYRDASPYWLKRLCFRAALHMIAGEEQDLTPYLKVTHAWFIFGFPKGNVPRFEARITKLIVVSGQLHIHFDDVLEVEKKNEYSQ